MKTIINYLILASAFLLSINPIFSKNKNLPPSFYCSNNIKVETYIVNPPDIKKLLKEDIVNDKTGTMMRVAKLIPISRNYRDVGKWASLDNGRNYWTIKFKSADALGSAIHFDSFYIPEGAKIYAYSADKKTIYGPYTNIDSREDYGITLGLFKDNEIVLEYYSPKSTNEKILPENFNIGRYSYIYRGINNSDYFNKNTGYGASDDCQVNVNCSEANNWRKQQKSVARLYIVDDLYAGFCSGTLINNTAKDGTPYFLTAYHCGGDITASNMNQWIASFNYEAPTCNYNTETMPEPTRNQVHGCTKIAGAELEGGSDFLLLRLNTNKNYLKGINAVYSGWRNTNAGGTSGVSIHHPSGDIKKISTYTSTISSTTYQGQGETGATNAYWRVYWAETDNGHGVTEGGSSGAPLFDQNGYLIGTLSGGSSFCGQTNWPDIYGKMSYHWTSNNSQAASQLKPWLDPLDLDVEVLNYLDLNETNNDCETIRNFPHTENFSDGILPNCWEVNSSNTNTWIPTTGYTISGSTVNPLQGSHFFYCYWAESDQDEWLISPAFNFSISANPKISFWFNGSHYWSVSPHNNCDLDLMISINDGEWKKIWNQTDNPDFNSDANYVWQKAEINLSDYANAPKARFAFRYTGNDGAAFAVDNIVIDGTCLNTGDYKKNTDIIAEIYPNPVSENIFIRHFSDEKVYIKLYNTLGKKIYSAEIYDKQSNINISNLNAGVYILEIRNSNQRQIEQVSIIK